MTKHPASAPADLTIGQLARAAQVNVETIRYYQRIGLVDEPARPPRGYRRYSPATAGRIRFIKRAQQLGFTLHEVADLLTLDDGDCHQARELAEYKRTNIQQRIKDLRAMQQALDALIRRCQSDGGPVGHCAIIQTLNRDVTA